MKKFSSSVIEKIQYYVYILIDPRDDKIFYIWKWKWSRIFSHLNGAISWDKPSNKINLIQELLSGWFEVQHYIVRHGLTEKESLEVEWALIDFYGKSNLTNILLWHNSGERWLMNINEININYDAQEVEIVDEVILININTLYYFWISEEELYQATRKSWKAKMERANKAQYVFCHYHGIIREVYEINDWYESLEYPSRIEFNWKVASDNIREKYIYKSISNYFTKGNQNPIKYVNI